MNRKLAQSIQDKIHYIIYITVFFFLFGVIILHIAYPDQIDYLSKGISWLGALKTVNGYDNTTNFIVFMITFGIVAIGHIFIGVLVLMNENIENSSYLSMILFLSGASFIITIVPVDGYEIIHDIGGVALFLFIALLIFVLFYKNLTNNGIQFTLVLVHLLLTASYLATKFLYNDISGILQRIVLFSYMTCILISTTTNVWYGDGRVRGRELYEEEKSKYFVIQEQDFGDFL